MKLVLTEKLMSNQKMKKTMIKELIIHIYTLLIQTIPFKKKII